MPFDDLPVYGLNAGDRLRILGVYVIEEHDLLHNVASRKTRYCVDIPLSVRQAKPNFRYMIRFASLRSLAIVACEIASRAKDVEPGAVARIIPFLCGNVFHYIPLSELFGGSEVQFAKA